MTKKPTRFLTTASLVLAICLGFLTVRVMSDFDLSQHTTRQISFSANGAVLSGTLVTPKGSVNPPIAVFVHGDGAQDRFSDGGYLTLITAFARAGIGVFSWDKAGVGESTGNWLDQSMDDRAAEALAAHKAISDLEDVEASQVGFLGFSQAGWVLPRVASQTSPAFTIIIGAPVSWRDQGTYYNRIRMANAGIPAAQREQLLNDRLRRNDIIFIPPADPLSEPNMNEDRFNFVAAAYWEDVTGLLHNIQGPVFAIWGEDDLNVDAVRNAAIYRSELSPLSEIRRVVVVPNATHSLLRTRLFNYQLPSSWPWFIRYTYIGLGRYAYADKVPDRLSKWINEVLKTAW